MEKDEVPSDTRILNSTTSTSNHSFEIRIPGFVILKGQLCRPATLAEFIYQLRPFISSRLSFETLAGLADLLVAQTVADEVPTR
jgi:hypothetical protein